MLCVVTKVSYAIEQASKYLLVLHRKLEMKQACNCKKCGYKRDKKKGDDRSGDGMSVLEGMREMEV